MCHSSEQKRDIELESEEKPRHVPRQVILRIARRDDVAPRGGARGHADEGIGGARRRGGGGGDGEVDPPQLVRTGYGNLSANYPPGCGGGHACLPVVGDSASATPAVAAGRRVLEREWVLGGEMECGSEQRGAWL